MTFLNSFLGINKAATAVAEPVQPQQAAPVVQQQIAPPVQTPPEPVVITNTTTNPTALTTTVTGQELAAPVANSNLCAKVVSLLAPVAQKALANANVEGQDFTGASSIANFISKPVIDQLRGDGKGWEGSKQQTYVRELIQKLADIAKEPKNDSATAQDAVKSIAYIAANIESPEASELAFEKLLDIADPATHSLADHTEAQTRQNELQAITQSLVSEVVTAKPTEAVKSVLKRAHETHSQQSQATLKTVITTALQSPNNKNGAVKMAMITQLGSFDSTGFGNHGSGVLKHQVQTLKSVQQALTESGLADQELNTHLAGLSQNLTAKIAERQSS